MLVRLTARRRPVALTFVLLVLAAGAVYAGLASAGNAAPRGPMLPAFFVGGSGGAVTLSESGFTYAGVSSQSTNYDDVEQVLGARLNVGHLYCRQEYPTATTTTVTLEVNLAAASPACSIAPGQVLGSTPLNTDLEAGWSIAVKIASSSPDLGTVTWSLGP
jgi:hypothetical protein